MDPDINNVEVPDWIAVGSSVFFFIMLCLPFWVRAGGDGIYINFGAQWGWVAIIGAIAVWATFALVLLGVDLPFPKWIGYIAGGGFASFITLLMVAIRPAGWAGGLGITKLPWVASWLAILACAGMIVAGLLKKQTEYY